jgi:hypothetical protein
VRVILDRGSNLSSMFSHSGVTPRDHEVNRQDPRRLLDRIGVFRHPCDLDLLLFFVRHPHTLSTSEQLAVWLGYELEQIADSLEVLMEARLLTRSQNPTHAARMYVFAIGELDGGWLRSLVESASTREGRLALIEALSRRAPEDTGDPAACGSRETTATPRQRPFGATEARRDPTDLVEPTAAERHDG